MKNTQALSDQIAIGLSVLCAIHCLALPLLVVILPSIVALQLENEAFHYWMLLAVVPTSAYALSMGCREHKHYRLLAIGGLGLLCLFAAVLIGETMLGESGEKVLTLIGVSIVAFGHFRNFRLCREKKPCHCPAKNKQ